MLGSYHGTIFMVCGWLWALILPASPSTANVLPSLADLDFHRLKTDQFHSFEIPAISVQRSLVGAGYHRQLVTRVTLEETGEFENGRILVVENITCEMYIDLDQIMSMDEFELDFEMLSSAHMDTEKPASASTGHVVLIYSHFINSSVELSIPIHFRYQPPSPNSTYSSVLVPSPLLLIPHPLGSASLPCHAHTRDTCPWELLDTETSPQDHQELRALIPCGLQNLTSQFIIALTTLITLAASAIITCAIAGAPSNSPDS